MTLRDMLDGLPPPMHPNRIEAAYLQMRNNGQFYIGQLGGHPIHIMDWRDQELKRWELYASEQGEKA